MKTKYPYSLFRKPVLLMSFGLLLVMLVGCNLPSRVAGPATATLPPTITPPGQQQNSPTPPSATQAPTTTANPTASPTTTPQAVNILFATGTTAAVETGAIQPNQVLAYTLGAGQNQPMVLIVNSPRNDVTIGVTEPDGTVLLDPAKKYTTWQWLLPKTEQYTIQVYGGAISEDYTLTTKVAEIVNFASGLSAITLSGSTPKGYVVSYAVSCKAGQVMNVSLNVPATTAYLDVFGLATGPLLSDAARVTSWSGTLPSNQDYVVEVIPAGGQIVNYTLTVSVH
jgi:hypothetical protein